MSAATHTHESKVWSCCPPRWGFPSRPRPYSPLPRPRATVVRPVTPLESPQPHPPSTRGAHGSSEIVWGRSVLPTVSVTPVPSLSVTAPAESRFTRRRPRLKPLSTTLSTPSQWSRRLSCPSTPPPTSGPEGWRGWGVEGERESRVLYPGSGSTGQSPKRSIEKHRSHRRGRNPSDDKPRGPDWTLGVDLGLRHVGLGHRV